MTGKIAGVERLVYSSAGLKFAASLARATPPRVGYSVGRWVARWIASRRGSALVSAVRANQRVLAGEGISVERVEQNVRGVFHNSAASVYELYHYMHDPAALERMYRIDTSFQPYAARAEFEGRGLVIAGLHMAGFDLGLRWLCRYKFKPLVITIPSPQQGRQLELEGRQEMQMNVLPASVNALHRAVRHLQQGGMVLTGIDHPVPPCEVQPCFLGQLATLPTDHIYLAVRAKVPVVVAASRLESDGAYHIYASAPIEMDAYADRLTELRMNAARVLASAADFIARAPEQWLIFQPAWPG